MGAESMNFAYELHDDQGLWEEQQAVTCGEHFQTFSARPGATEEILKSVSLQHTERATTDDFSISSGSDTVLAQGSRVLDDFSPSGPQAFTSLPNVVVVARHEWPLQAKLLSSLEPGAVLNTFLWIERFQDEQQMGFERKRLALSQEVFEFCSQHRLLGHLQRAVELVGECFPSAVDVSVEKECDPESEDEWLLLTTQIHEQVESALDLYDTYTRRLIDAIPWPQRNKIRFNYDLV